MDSINNAIRPVYKENNNPYTATMISIITAKQCARISVDEIEMVEQVGRVMHVVTADRDYTLYANVKCIEKVLEGRAFYRPLKCLFINFDRVKSIGDMYIYFQSGQCATMGKNSFSKTRSAFRKYLEEYPSYALHSEVCRVAEKTC